MNNTAELDEVNLNMPLFFYALITARTLQQAGTFSETSEPLAVNTSNQCLKENNTYIDSGGSVPPNPITTYTLGSSPLPAGLTPVKGQGALSNVNALGTTYVLGYSTAGSICVWDGTNTITLPESFTLPGPVEAVAVNAATTTITGANGTPQTVPAAQVVAADNIWNMVPSTTSPPTFGNPQVLDDLVPSNTPWSSISCNNGWPVGNACINDSGAICAQGTYTPTGPTDTTPAGVHGLVLLPVSFVREDPPGSGNFQPIKDNGLDDNAVLPMFHPDMATTLNRDETCSGGYAFTAQLSQNLSSTSTASMTVAFQNSSNSYNGTLTETAAGSGVFKDSSNVMTVALSPTNQTTTNSTVTTLNVTVTDSALGFSNAPFVLNETAPAILNFTADVVLAEVDLSGPLSTTAVNTLTVSLDDSENNNSVVKTLTETGVNTRIFRDSKGDMTVTINSLSGTAMQISIQDNFLQVQTATLALTETSSTSNTYANFTETPTTFTALDPGSSGEGVFYIQMPNGSSSVPITLSSGANSVTVNATPVSGSPGIIRTPPLALLAPGTSGTYSGITTLQIDGTNSVCATIFGSKIDPKPAPGAFICRAKCSLIMPTSDTSMLDFLDGAAADQHLNTIEQTLIGAPSASIKGLGWTVTKDQVVTYSDITTALPKYSLFYFYGEGGTPSGDTSTSFVGFSVWPNYLDISTHPLTGTGIFPSTISANIGSASYQLVFINGCASADDTSSSGVPMAFATAFQNASAQSNPSQVQNTAYVGWSTSVNMGVAATAGERFFTELTSTTPGVTPTVQNAVDQVNQNLPGASGINDAAAQLVPITGKTQTIDLTPIPPASP